MSQETAGSEWIGLARWRESVLVRIVGAALLVLLLQIPVLLIASTIDERRMTKDAAVGDVTRTWGASQELTGPILNVPFIHRWLDEKGEARERTVVRHFLPRNLSVRGRADTQVRRRGIFDVPLFVAELEVAGTFSVPEASQFATRAEDIQWQRASLSFGISDPKAIRASSPLTVGARHFAFEPGAGDANLATGLHVMVAEPGRPGTILPFRFDLTVGGSGRLSFVPVGDETTVVLASPWRDPSFDGAWLPIERQVGAAGFDATWRVLNLGRNFPGTWVDREADPATLSAAAFGVTLLSPVDTYRANDRAVKYQLLFLGLTFLAITLFDLLARLRVHPFQYLLVGLALCLFYLLLLSLSEQIGFARAYVIAAAMIVGLVTTYASFVLGKWSRGLVIGASLAVLYAFLFVLLHIQDYALLAGSLGLFVVLAAIMWFTRRVNWYEIGASPR